MPNLHWIAITSRFTGIIQKVLFMSLICRVQNSAYKSVTCMPYIKKQTKERHSKTTTTSSSGFKPKFPTSLHLHRGSLTTQLLNPKNKNNYDFIQVE
jgi:hypothetical protein